MSDINELESRITAALDRVRSGLGKLEKPAPAPQEPPPDAESVALVAKLEGQLNEERDANAQMAERVKALKERQDGQVSGQEERLGDQRAQIVRVQSELLRLRQVNESLRSSITRLREANTSQIGDPHLVNKAMLAELDAMRAAQSADASEIADIVTQLKPLVEEA